MKEGENLKAELLVGTTQGWPSFNAANRRWSAPGGPLYAAWLPFRGDRMLAKGHTYKHGAHVDVKLQLIQHRNPRFRFWEVVAIKGVGESWLAHEKRRVTQAAEGDYAPAEEDGRPVIRWGRGYVCRTNHNIKNKHDERVLLVGTDDEHDIDDAMKAVLRADISEVVARRWRDLIRSCQELHRDAINERIARGVKPSANVRAGNPSEEDQPAFSRHTYETDADKLDQGTLAYARLEIGPSGQARLNADRVPVIGDLFPVMIGRELGNWSPLELLQKELRPAMSLDELSPADRVFGWVRDESANQAGSAGTSLKPPAAWKGQLRIAPIRCEGVYTAQGGPLQDDGRPASAIQAVGDDSGLPLAILSAPKPSQARFYAARNKDGAPFADGADIRQQGYFERRTPQSAAPQARLRGRKVYPHHRASCQGSVFESYWNPAEAWDDARADRLAAVPGSPLYREYLRRAEVPGQPKQDSQNRSIRDWVRPGTRFATHIDVVNLNAAELGALLWLLDLGRERQGGQPAAHLRLGGGKPLGFGSVKVRIASLDLVDGEAKRQEYLSFVGTSDAERAALAESGLRLSAAGDAVHERLGTSGGPVAAFKTAIEKAYGEGQPGSFHTVPSIEGFLIAARGFADALPLHYPRRNMTPDPDGRNYEWFVENARGQTGQRLSLPDIARDTGLPLDPATRQGRPPRNRAR